MRKLKAPTRMELATGAFATLLGVPLHRRLTARYTVHGLASVLALRTGLLLHMGECSKGPV